MVFNKDSLKLTPENLGADVSKFTKDIVIATTNDEKVDAIGNAQRISRAFEFLKKHKKLSPKERELAKSGVNAINVVISGVIDKPIRKKRG